MYAAGWAGRSRSPANPPIIPLGSVQTSDMARDLRGQSRNSSAGRLAEERSESLRTRASYVFRFFSAHSIGSLRLEGSGIHCHVPRSAAGDSLCSVYRSLDLRAHLSHAVALLPCYGIVHQSPFVIARALCVHRCRLVDDGRSHVAVNVIVRTQRIESAGCSSTAHGSAHGCCGIVCVGRLSRPSHPEVVDGDALRRIHPFLQPSGVVSLLVGGVDAGETPRVVRADEADVLRLVAPQELGRG